LSVQLFSKFPTYVVGGPNPPTLQTDGLTTCNRNTALCSKVHRAVMSILEDYIRSPGSSRSVWRLKRSYRSCCCTSCLSCTL